MEGWYIASCVFTSRFPALSRRIRETVRERYKLSVVRCCVPRYKLREFEERMPEGAEREAWRSLPDSRRFAPGDTVYSLCHNCNNIIEELYPGVAVRSLWELIDEDEAFPLPDLRGRRLTVQDCWRARERADEQRAVRSLLRKMGAELLEAPDNGAQTRFCGVSLYRPQPPRNPKLAPKHYVDGAQGLFLPHTEEQQKQLMEAWCSRLPSREVVCSCHYCLEGLLLGGADAKHIAQLLFEAL